MIISIVTLLLGNLFASKLVLDFGSNFECDLICEKQIERSLPDIISYADHKLSAIGRSKTTRERRSALVEKLCEAIIFE